MWFYLIRDVYLGSSVYLTHKRRRHLLCSLHMYLRSTRPAWIMPCSTIHGGDNITAMSSRVSLFVTPQSSSLIDKTEYLLIKIYLRVDDMFAHRSVFSYSL